MYSSVLRYGRVFSSCLMGTRSRGESWEGRHSKQKEIIMLFFSYQFCSLKLPWRDVFRQSSSHFQTKELFSLPSPSPFPQFGCVAGEKWLQALSGNNNRSSPLETSWVRFMSAHRKRERERGRKKKGKLPGQINNSLLEDASPVLLLLYNSLSQDPAISYLLKQESHTGKTSPCSVSCLVIGAGRGDMLTKVCTNKHLKWDVLLGLQ